MEEDIYHWYGPECHNYDEHFQMHQPSDPGEYSIRRNCAELKKQQQHIKNNTIIICFLNNLFVM